MSHFHRVKQINNFFQPVIICGSSLFCFANYCKHTFLVNTYRDYSELLGHDGPVKPSEQLMGMISTVEEDVKGLASENTSIVPSIVPGLRTIHLGTFGTLYGGFIGLPIYFEFNNKEDVDNKIKKTNSLITDKPLEEFYDCFVLSDKAKKFGIAREILFVNSYKVPVQSILPVGVAFLMDFVYTNFNATLKLYKLHPLARTLTYGLLLGLVVSFCRRMHVISNEYFESTVEDTVASFGADYAEGGVEYYTKALERRSNQLDWADQNSRLLNKISDKCYSFVSQSDSQLVNRIAFFKSKVLPDAVNKDEKSSRETTINQDE